MHMTVMRYLYATMLKEILLVGVVGIEPTTKWL